ncbi:MAG: LysR family transcriptional regulator [Sandaracinaceae bacterium]
MDRWTALTVFRTAAELGSFAATARQLGLSPAAVSKNVSELEAELSVRLFHRTTRRMSLTAEGALYYERVAPALDEVTDANAELGAMHDEPRGHLRVSAPISITLTCLSTRIPAFLARHPHLTLDLALDDRRVDLVAQGFDLAVRGSDRLEDSSLIARRLATLDHVLCASPAYLERSGTPRAPEELGAHSLLRFSLSDHADEWTFRRGGRAVRVPVRSRYSVGSSLAVRDALRAGFGLTLIPRVYVEEDLAERRLVSVLDDWVGDDTTLYAVYPSRRYVVPKVRAFIDFLSEAFA